MFSCEVGRPVCDGGGGGEGGGGVEWTENSCLCLLWTRVETSPLPPSLPRQPSPSPQDLKIAADYQQSGDGDSDPDLLRNLHPKRTANGWAVISFMQPISGTGFLGRIECKPGCVFVFSFSKDIFYCVMLPLVIKSSTGKKFWVWKKKRELNNLTNKQKNLNFTPKASLCTLIISRTAVHLSLSDCWRTQR